MWSRHSIAMQAAALGLGLLAGCANKTTAPGAAGPSDEGVQSSPAAAASQPPAAAAVAQVQIKLFRFQPDRITVAPGTTVQWTNDDDINHTVSSGTPDKAGGPLNGKLPGRGSIYRYTFDASGEYPYFCDYHSSMVGTIVVKQP